MTFVSATIYFLCEQRWDTWVPQVSLLTKKVDSAVSQFHVYLPWGQRPFSIMCLKFESGSSSFQPGEGPSRGLLRDCTTSPINRFAALVLAAQCRHYPCLNTAPPRSAHNILHTDYSQFVQVVNGKPLSIFSSSLSMSLVVRWWLVLSMFHELI